MILDINVLQYLIHIKGLTDYKLNKTNIEIITKIYVGLIFNSNREFDKIMLIKVINNYNC